MNTKIITPLLTLFAIWLTACASLEITAYKTIGSIAVSVDAGMKAYGEAVRQGRVNADQQAQAKQLYTQYQAAMAVAQRAVTDYKTLPTKDKLNTALDTVSLSAAHLIEFINLFIPKEK